ncbi:hypothetical protein MMC11_005543 [Xylographa trunciseda]|nr:hypothetical protein [Xylographa trunciseda]
MQAEAGSGSANLLDKNQNLISVYHLGGSLNNYFENWNWHDANISSDTVLGNHSLDNSVQGPTLYGFQTDSHSRHGAPSSEIYDLEDPFTETGLDLPENRAFEFVQHEPPYSFDAHGIGQRFSTTPAIMPPTTQAMEFNTTGYLSSSAGLGQQSSSTNTIAIDNALRFPCSFLGCTKAFKRSADRDRHYRKHQPEAASYHCAVMGCKYNEGKGFYRHDKLLSHERNVHKLHPK